MTVALDVRYWPKADIAGCSAHVRFGSKADITICGTHVCFRGRYWG
jgi:hypothetical protein